VSLSLSSRGGAAELVAEIDEVSHHGCWLEEISINSK
jgi:hypothetical protein